MEAVNTVLGNPEYNRLQPSWIFVDDCYKGTREVKYGPGVKKYLPMFRREEAEARSHQGNSEHYNLRLEMANYENFFRPTIDDIVGIMQANRSTVKFGVDSDEESPEEVRDILWYGNQYNDGLAGLKHRLNHNQVLYGRYGMLLDIITDDDGLRPRFCISEYPAWKILDGQTQKDRPDAPERLRWCLLDETTRRHNPETKIWEVVTRWRVLALDSSGYYYQAVLEGTGSVEVFQVWAQFDILAPPPELAVYPTFKGKRLDFIPLTVCNVNRLGFDQWQAPPYEDVAHIAINNYRIDAVYKQALLNHATPTLVVCNAPSRENKEIYLGGALWLNSQGAAPISVHLLETSGSGMGEMRTAKENVREALKYSSIRDLLDGAGANSSAEAMKLRTNSGTAAISAMDQTGARAIEEQLCFASEWAGATREETADRITFSADTSYLSTDLQLQSVAAMLQINQQTRTLSNEALYKLLERAVPGVLPSYEDNEVQKLADEENTLGILPTQVQEVTTLGGEKDEPEEPSGREKPETETPETGEKKEGE